MTVPFHMTLVLSGVAFAEGTCGYNTPIVADGRITHSTIPALGRAELDAASP